MAFMDSSTTALVAGLCGIGAVVFAGVVAVPQVRRILRTGDTAGVSATTAALTVVACSSWAVYGVLEHLTWTVVSCSVACATWLPLLVMLARDGRWGHRSQLLTAGVSVALLAALTVGGVTALGTALVIHGIAQYAPQVRVALRSPDLSGISVLSQALYFLCAVSNLGIAVIAHDGPLTAWAVTFMTASTIVMVRCVQTNAALQWEIREALRHPLVTARLSSHA